MERSGVPTADQRALVALYQQTGGDRWRRREGWLTEPDPCAWAGIRCTGGQVTGIDLSRNRLTGTLPSELGLLAALTHLTLSHNRLTGPIPPEVGNLRGLVVLDLAENELRGALPARLRLLQRLRVLDLHGNALNGPVPSALHDLVALERLDLSDNAFEGPLPPELGKLSNLVRLALDHNSDLSGPLPETLVNLRALSAFSFEHTGLLERSEPAFQAWLTGIPDLARTGVLYAEVVTRRDTTLAAVAAAVAGLGTLGAGLVAALLMLPFLGPIASVLAALAGTAGGGLVGKLTYDLTSKPRALPGTLPRAALGAGGDFRAEGDEDVALRAALTRELQQLVRGAEPALPADVVDKLEEVEHTLLDLLGRVPHLGGSDPDAFLVRQTVRDYLPEALASYRAIPADFATGEPIGAGKTAHDHLLQQLEDLHAGLRQVADRRPQEAAQRLLVHGRFLKGKFREEGGVEEEV